MPADSRLVLEVVFREGKLPPETEWKIAELVPCLRGELYSDVGVEIDELRIFVRHGLCGLLREAVENGSARDAMADALRYEDLSDVRWLLHNFAEAAWVGGDLRDTADLAERILLGADKGDRRMTSAVFLDVMGMFCDHQAAMSRIFAFVLGRVVALLSSVGAGLAVSGAEIRRAAMLKLEHTMCWGQLCESFDALLASHRSEAPQDSEETNKSLACLASELRLFQMAEREMRRFWGIMASLREWRAFLETHARDKVAELRVVAVYIQASRKHAILLKHSFTRALDEFAEAEPTARESAGEVPPS